MLGGNGSGVDGLRCFKGTSQHVTLRIRLVLPPCAPAHIGFARQQKRLEAFGATKRIHRFESTENRRGAQLCGTVAAQVVTCNHNGELAIVVGHAQAPAQVVDELNAPLLVTEMLRPLGFRRLALAEIMYQGGKAHTRVRRQTGRLRQHHHRVQTAIDFRVILRRLRHAEERVDFGKNARQCSALPQRLEKARRRLLRQGTLGLGPDPFGHEMIDLA